MNGDGTITGNNVLGFIDNNARKHCCYRSALRSFGFWWRRALYTETLKAIHNGADDNASGVAVTVNLAAKLKTKHTRKQLFIYSLFWRRNGIVRL